MSTTTGPTEEYSTVPIRDWLASLPSADPKWGNCDSCGTATDDMVCLGASSSYCRLCAACMEIAALAV